MCAVSPAVAGNRTLVISTQDTPLAEIAGAVLSEACSRLGIRVRYAFVPYRRSLHMSRSGEYDGELIRRAGTADQYPEFVMVPVPLCFVRVRAFAVQEYPIRTWEDLRGVRIGILRGVLLYEEKTKGMSPHMGETTENLLFLLQKERLQVAVLSELSGIAAARSAGLYPAIRPVGEELAFKPLYLHLHKSRADLVPQLEKVLREMEKSGEIAALQKQVRRNILAHAEEKVGGRTPR